MLRGDAVKATERLYGWLKVWDGGCVGENE